MVFVPATSSRLESQFQEWFQEKTAEAMRLEMWNLHLYSNLFSKGLKFLPHRKTIWFPHQKKLCLAWHLPPISTSQMSQKKHHLVLDVSQARAGIMRVGKNPTKLKNDLPQSQNMLMSCVWFGWIYPGFHAICQSKSPSKFNWFRFCFHTITNLFPWAKPSSWAPQTPLDGER